MPDGGDFLMIVLSDEQIMLRDMARSWVEDRAPISALRAVRTTYAEQGMDPALYQNMAEWDGAASLWREPWVASTWVWSASG